MGVVCIRTWNEISKHCFTTSRNKTYLQNIRDGHQIFDGQSHFNKSLESLGQNYEGLEGDG
jgi:hypothetical protein